MKRTEEGLKMHVECETRPGLMLGMMEMLESWGLSLDQANIECVDQRLILDGTGSEVGTVMATIIAVIAPACEIDRRGSQS